jgi:hypothetical protein
MENYVRAQAIVMAGFHPETGDAVIKADWNEDSEVHFAFPADDIPKLMFSLSQAYKENVTEKNADESLRLANAVDSARFLLGPDEESIGLLLDLSVGTPVSLMFPRSVAERMQRELNALLG